MAVILVLVGSLAGFLLALTGMILGSLGPVAALGLWSATGLGFTLLGIGLAALPSRCDRGLGAPNRNLKAFFS